MSRAILIAVRFHDGRYHGTGNWPPSPGRLFQALVAAAACGSTLSPTAKTALEWIERLPPPEICVPRARRGQRITYYVPNNDLDAAGYDPGRIGEIRAGKLAQPYVFDAGIPLLYVWHFDAEVEAENHARSICTISESLYQFGRGVDMAWACGEVLAETDCERRLASGGGIAYRPVRGAKGVSLDCPLPGSLESLRQRFAANNWRFSRVGGGGDVEVLFTQAPKPRFRSVSYNSPPALRLFDRRASTAEAAFAPWLQEHPSALVIHLRDAAEARLHDTLPERRGEIERALIGRQATEADKAVRVRIVPLPSIGHHHADRSIRRVLIEVPPNCPIDVGDITWAFSGIVVKAAKIDRETGEILEEETRLVPAVEETMLTHYGVNDSQSYRQWRTVTPAALPEHAARRRIDPRRRRDEAKPGSERTREQHAAATAVLQVLRHARIDTLVSSMRVQREPFDGKGGRAEAFAHGTRFAKERLWHVEIDFAQPVAGPLMFGDGRYMGLGLLAPVRRIEGVHCFAILDGLAGRVAETSLAQALRRAVMARVQDAIGRRERLPEFFSGHQPSGEPSRSGAHEHLAFAADLSRRRLLIVAPHVLEGREPTTLERKYLATLDSSVADLEDLRAGAAGRLKLSRTAIDPHGDALFAPAQIWKSVTDYQPTRYAKCTTNSEALMLDVRSELNRRRIAAPIQIEVTEVHEGPRGGLAGRLRLHFANVICGPILIGRTRHFGGGLFAATPRSRETHSQV